MAKTNPIGVRFDTELLEQIKLEQNLTSPQKVVNWLFENYRNCVLNTEKGVTIINPDNGLILQDFPNPKRDLKMHGKEYPKSDNEDLEKQIALIKMEVKPSFIGSATWEKSQLKRISELKNKIQ